MRIGVAEELAATGAWSGAGYTKYTMGKQSEAAWTGMTGTGPGPVTEAVQAEVGFESESTIVRKVEARRQAAYSWTSMCLLYSTVQFGASPRPHYEFLVGGSVGDGAWRGLVAIVELIDLGPYSYRAR